MRHLSGAHSRPLFLSCSERFINDRRNERTKLARSEVRIEPSSIISQEMLARLADTEERRSLLEGGGGYTEAFGPDGSTVAGPLDPSQEGLLFADLDMSLIAVAKMAGDPTGHYSRPDVTRLLLNRQPRLAVQAFSPNETAPDMVVPRQAAPSTGQDKRSLGSSVTESTIEVHPG